MPDVGLRDHHALAAGQAAGRQTSKNPSIFSLTPPIGWISPRWFTEPVTAMACRSGMSGEAREQRVELGGRGAVAVDLRRSAARRQIEADSASGRSGA